jgi:branched-chain amino acid transport system ATP-binding protein
VQAEQGFAILLVEHDVELVASFTERAYVLDFGMMIAEGATADVLGSAAVRSAYLGDAETRG